MEKEIINELTKNCSWKEIIIIKAFKRMFVKAYRKGMINAFNWFNI